MRRSLNLLKAAVTLALACLVIGTGNSQTGPASSQLDPPPRPSGGALSKAARLRAPGGVPGPLFRLAGSDDPPPGPRTPLTQLSFEGVAQTAALTGFIPPDTHMAVGTGSGAAGRVVEVTNGCVQIWDKTGASLAGPTAFNTFFGTVAADTFDPKVLFDQQSGRFFAVVLQENDGATTSQLTVAVSTSSTPSNLGADWNRFTASAVVNFGGTNTWMDYPCLGADASSLFVTGNMFTFPANPPPPALPSFRGIKIRVFNKASLIGGTNTFSDIDVDASITTGIATVQPAHVYGTTDSGNFYLIDRIGPSNYRLWEIQGAPAAPSIKGNASRVWTAGSVINNAPQPGSGVRLDTVSARVMSAVYRNGIVTCCLTSDLNADGRSDVLVPRIATNGGLPTAPTVAGTGSISGSIAGSWAFMPAVNVNAHGEILVCYTESGTANPGGGIYPQMRYNSAPFSAGSLTFGSPVAAKNSAGFYDSGYGFSPDRWGDYAAVGVDPVDDSFWMAQEYCKTSAAGASVWGTFIVKTFGPTTAQLTAFQASACEGGTYFQWRTGFEAENLGFHLWADQGGQRQRLTPSLVAGSAVLASGTALTAGHSYTWWEPGPPADAYWLEAVELSGKSSWYGPVQPAFGARPAPEHARSALLAGLGRQAAGAAAITATPMACAVLASPGAQAAAAALAANAVPQLAGGPAVKITVRREGWYRATQPELLAAGLDPRANPRTFQLFAEGQEQAILVRGEADGRFDAGDAIEFYGLGLDTPSTDARVYWLVWGRATGRRISTAKAVSLRSGPGSFPFTIEQKERTLYVSAIHNGDASNFFGRLITAEPTTLTLNVAHLDPASPGPAVLQVLVQGLTDVPQRGPDHRVSVRLNWTTLGEIIFDGQSQGTLSVPLPAGLLQEGENVLALASEAGDSEGIPDISLLDTVRLTYWHTYTADGETLRFTAPAGQQVTVDGFSTRDVRVVDVTNPAQPQELAVGASQAAAAGFAVRVGAPGPGGQPRLMLAFAAGAVRELADETGDLSPNRPSNLHDGGRGADLVILAHRSLIPGLQPLKALREQQGLAVAMVDVEDVYDEFNWGEKDPAAIRDFLAWASGRWRKPPRFVLLAGDATFDPRNYLGAGNADLVPTKLVDTQWMETACDGWFADFNGDGVPEMAVGRLPCRTPGQADAVVAKILRYEQTAPGGPARALLVADENDGFRFDAASAAVRALLPAGVQTQDVSGTRANAVDARQQVLQAIQGGQTLVNYLGHGAVEIWAHQLLTAEDARQFSNGQRLPFVAAMTCLNGYFQDVYLECLGEALVNNPKGGAVAVWASSGLTEPEGQAAMDQQLYQLLFSGRPVMAKWMTLGEATTRAKAATSDLDVRRTWNLIGDPTTRLRR